MRLHVHEFGPGAGRTVVALHGVTSSALGLRRLAERLPGYRIVAPDFRGHGSSGTNPPWDLSVHLRDLRETLDRLGIAQAPFIGFSFGGRIAVELVAAERSRVERLVLLEPALQVDPGRAAASADALLTDTSYGSTEEAIDARIASGWSPYAPREHWERWSEQLITGIDGRLRLPFSRAAAIAIYGELTTPPPPFDVLRLPTLLVLGSESTLVTPRQLERYRYDLGDYLEVKTVRAKHQVIGDAADEVAAAIGAFLAR
ncbi:MAG: lipase [Chloroflexota bacterium]|nr:lipase [Chloroflexota bacterium]